MLQEEQRDATEAKRHVLGRWGATGLAQIFDDCHRDYDADHTELRELLSDAEYQAARHTTINAHYTDPRVVTHIWDSLDALGFTGGRDH